MYRWVILCLGLELMSELKISRKFDPYLLFLAGIIVCTAVLEGVSEKTDRYPDTFKEFWNKNLECIGERTETAEDKKIRKMLEDMEAEEQPEKEEGEKVQIEVVITD